MNARYHVVCHDCEHEQLLGGGKAAAASTHIHGDRTGHDVEYARVC